MTSKDARYEVNLCIGSQFRMLLHCIHNDKYNTFIQVSPAWLNTVKYTGVDSSLITRAFTMTCAGFELRISAIFIGTLTHYTASSITVCANESDESALQYPRSNVL